MAVSMYSPWSTERAGQGRGGRWNEACMTSRNKAWGEDDEARAKGNKDDQTFQKRCSSGFVVVFKSIQGVCTL